MSWHGANTLHYRGGRQQGTHRSNEPPRETVEAMVNRLRKAYALAMQCVGAFHRADAAISASQTNDPSARNSLLRVGRAARRTFEQSILMDPLVDAPAWTRTFPSGVRKLSSSVQLTSTRDQSTVQQLTYLSLVNYADLLLMGLPPSTHVGTTILDRGLVKCLPSLHLDVKFVSCWTSGSDATKDEDVSESEEQTIRFALVAYIDATSLDASDPTVWLKLACAARRLNHCLDLPVAFGKYRRLERYALERAVSALSARDPPNRLAVQALREWHSEEEEATQEYPESLVWSCPSPVEMVIEVPRYSWSTLGRLLLRACKDGTAYPFHKQKNHGEGSHALSKPVFLSPNVTIHVSPLLVLPTTLLARMISFLPRSQVWRLEATCRALSASVIAARALLQDQDTERRRSIEPTPVPPVDIPEEKEGERLGEASSEQNFEEVPVDHAAVETSKRISKRLQSQVLTSGKRAERNARRQSVDFCLRAAIFGCTADDPAYQQLLRSYGEIHGTNSDTSIRKSEECVVASSDKSETLEHWNIALLHDFVAEGSSSPFAWMFRFVAHVSMNVAQAFSNDPAGVMGLNSILLDCLQLMNRRTDLGNEFVTCWSQNSDGAPRDSGLRIIELFAIDLIHAELRLRRCDVEESSDIDFDSDSNFVFLLFPCLLRTAETIEHQVDSIRPFFFERWKSLKVRLYWLLASWYFWRGRHSLNVMDSRDAEIQGLEWIESIKKCIRISDVIPTPHLISPARVGLHWKEISFASMSLFADDIQASAVVLLAQEQFMNVARKFDSQENAQPLQQDDCDALLSIGETLMERYSCAHVNSSSKFYEIIDDFFSVHGETFCSLSISSSRCFDSVRKWFDTIVPSSHIQSGQKHIFPGNPSILTILVSCLCTKTDHCKTTVLLMSNLVITLIDLSEKLLSRKKNQWDRKLRSKVTDDASSSYESDSENSMSCSDEDEEKTTRKQNLNADDFKIMKYAVFIRVLLTKILSFCIDLMCPDDCSFYAQSGVFESVLSRALVFTTELFRFSRPVMNETDTPDEDLGIFLEIQRLFRFLVPCESNQDTWHLNLMRIYIDGLFYIVIVQRQILSNLSRAKPNKNGRALRLKTTRKRADLVAAASFDAGCILSKKFATIRAGRIERSYLFDEIDSSALRLSSLAVYLDSLVWFWKASSDISVDSNSDRRTVEEIHLSSYLDGFGRERLRVPIATAIIGLCGSASTASTTISDTLNDNVSLTEFYDSDISTIEWMNSLTDEEECCSSKKKATMRVIAQAVHCVHKVFGNIDEKEVCSYPYIESYTWNNGPELALVVARVLNSFASALLVQFRGKGVDAPESLWNDYPHGTQTTGALLDSVLWKAYKCLHGFSITNDTKESVTCSSGNAKLSSHYFLPESKEAGAMLYRCIMRAYSHGRRMPPRAALEAILAVLPKKGDSRKMSSIRNFLFSPTLLEDEMERLMLLASQLPNDDTTFHGCAEFDWLSTAEEDCDDETSRVLRGLSKLISQGPIPRIPDSGDENHWRSSSIQSEEELSTKFNALIDNLCFGNTKDWEGWFKASQCLNMKSDLIADRLGLSMGFTRSHNFYVPERRLFAKSNMQLADLLLLQESEQRDSSTGCVQSLGADLSLFVTFYWSSVESLKRCFHEINQFYESNVSSDSIQMITDHSSFHVWREIRNLFERNDLCRWQYGMGGLFVASLRIVAYRCLFMSSYLLNSVNVKDKDLVKSELAESLGVSLYVELMGSQAYGYPMKGMTDFRKRSIAVSSSKCFEQAIKLTQEEDDLSGQVETWDLFFMMGKCQEKIARTYDKEVFVPRSKNHEESRRYEYHMTKAIDAYAMSIAYANKIKKEGGFIAEHNGGSAHGVSEAVYRLHATRLKCLISAVDRPEDERELAELEALRLTECHWFQVVDDEELNLSVRQRVWKVLVDVVGALAKLSLDNSYFHRSVYRHAQALLWAPVLYDPQKERGNGSFESVPATWACKVRGLNYATNAAYSALSVISSLFSKKRTQLVAVWVTGDGSATTFQSINSSARKYDSLRGKYIAAYIDCLRLCRRRKELDVFLTWTNTCPRDLPSHFTVTVAGSNFRQGLPSDSLIVHHALPSSFHFLTSVRRLANSALANVILEDMIDFQLKEKTSRNVEGAKFYEIQLKLAYACFLRLNCDVGDLSKSRTWKFHRQNGVKDVVDALTFAFVNAFKESSISSAAKLSDWSGESLLNETLEAAIRKCKELYPSLSRNYSFSRQRTQQKSKGLDSSTSSKRKLSPNHEKRSFEVPIPEGLKEGDSFLTSVMVGETMKRVRLTVPSEAASSLRFSLQVPVGGSKNSTFTTTKNPTNDFVGDSSLTKT